MDVTSPRADGVTSTREPKKSSPFYEMWTYQANSHVSNKYVLLDLAGILVIDFVPVLQPRLHKLYFFMMYLLDIDRFFLVGSKSVLIPVVYTACCGCTGVNKPECSESEECWAYQG
jgi:hypothetical protein